VKDLPEGGVTRDGGGFRMAGVFSNGGGVFEWRGCFRMAGVFSNAGGVFKRGVVVFERDGRGLRRLTWGCWVPRSAAGGVSAFKGWDWGAYLGLLRGRTRPRLPLVVFVRFYLRRFPGVRGARGAR
jgi:hypothetical protein